MIMITIVVIMIITIITIIITMIMIIITIIIILIIIITITLIATINIITIKKKTLGFVSLPLSPSESYKGDTYHLNGAQTSVCHKT